MTHASIPLTALARFPQLILAWAVQAGAVIRPGRHRSDSDEPGDMIVVPLDAIPAPAGTDPGWSTKDDEPVQWPDRAPDDSLLLGDHVRRGHLDPEVRHAFAVVIEAHILITGALLPTPLLAALENVITKFVADYTAGGVSIASYLRTGDLSRGVRDALGTVLDVYLSLGDTRCLPTVLLVSLEQVHQLVAVPVRAAAAFAQDQAAGGDPR